MTFIQLGILKFAVLFLAASKNVFCKVKLIVGLSLCLVNQTIDSEDFVVGSPRNTSIEEFVTSNFRQVKFLQRHIGEKFPNLILFKAERCGLTIVHNFYFKDMGNLQKLALNANQIAKIEVGAFDDLRSLSRLDLYDNLIETLDEKVFVKMANLELIRLSKNKIKFLNPATFEIPRNEKLSWVDLRGNVCIDEWYSLELSNWLQLEVELRANCTQ